MDTDPTINESAPSVDEVKEAVVRLRGREAAGICNIRCKVFCFDPSLWELIKQSSTRLHFILLIYCVIIIQLKNTIWL